MSEIIGRMQGDSLKIAIVVSRFNELITKNLLEGCLGTLLQYSVPRDQITIVWVPGAFELPLTAKKLAKAHDAVICLGAVIQGATRHFDYVCSGATSGISQVALSTEKPIIFGMLTCDNLEQAIERIGVKLSNKGAESALAAIEMCSVLKQIDSL
ncbi:MAG: 6,7-dimethyl-8-ribityllumazine synthase [Chlamydiales bacterium]|jgi:6,7-dimethyl-8-ribityllumazine synthase|nr:6,7-dimethyl-8-ribityllumazine synthase [Chlamydiales bacterium]